MNQTVPLSVLRRPDLFWPSSLKVGISDYHHKGLAAFTANISMGCAHGCLFCTSPGIFNRQKKKLEEFDVEDPAMEWGNYMFPRIWDENDFRSSLRSAERMREGEILPDGHRAIQYGTTVDTFQVSRHPDLDVRAIQNDQLSKLFTNSLEMIRDESGLNVRILTRSPLAQQHFDLMKSLGNRLLFGMSIPSLDDALIRRYEPHAPGVMKRIETLQAAKEAGLNVYVAVGPTVPEQDRDDFDKFITVIKELDPITVFHEPINVSGQNISLMDKVFKEKGYDFDPDLFRDTDRWAAYAMGQLLDFKEVSVEHGLGDKLKLWPDERLLSKEAKRAIVEAGMFSSEKELEDWVENWWDTPSAWHRG